MHSYEATNLTKNVVFNIEDVLSAAIAVDDTQGFISGKDESASWNADTNNPIKSNKTLVKEVLTDESCQIKVTDEHYARARELREFFSNLSIEKKMMGNLQGFDLVVGKIVDADSCDLFAVSVCASMPHSYRMQQLRDKISSRLQSLERQSEYIGEPGRRERMEVEVLDVKYIRHYRAYLLTGIVNGKNVVKSTWRSSRALPTISTIVSNEVWEIDATIVSHVSDDKVFNGKTSVLTAINFNKKVT